MSDHERSFWRRLEMLVMAAACGTLLGTGLLAGVISFGSGDVAASPAADDAAAAVFHDDGRGAYIARVVIDGVPLRMTVDTGAAQSRLSEEDAQRLPLAPGVSEAAGGIYSAESVDIAGQTLHGMTLVISPTSRHSVIGLNWLRQMGTVTLEPSDQRANALSSD